MHNKPHRVETSARGVSWGDDSNIQEKLEIRLQEIEEIRTKRKSLRASQEMREATIEALGRRAFHLPSNRTWKADWFQYMANNHPFLAVFLSFRISPIGFGERITGLAVSVLIALSVTNGAFLFQDMDNTLNEEIVSFSWSKGDDDSEFQVTLLLVCLWFGASLLHAIHDALVWNLCCTQVMLGYLFWVLLWIGVAVMISAVVADKGTAYDPIRVLVYASIELGIAWLIWYPLVATVIFSGILGCCSMPFFGGRPREIRRRQLQVQRNKSKHPMNTLASLDDYDASTVARTASP
mmetsp:Transcript_39021/g.94352  ORF Transcript_39021/g.94352 Transcript_39021/m.94352 type:complete len:294 (-) Transcript_39021:153-1034(-)